jgi:hypothetical protein
LESANWLGGGLWLAPSFPQIFQQQAARPARPFFLFKGSKVQAVILLPSQWFTVENLTDWAANLTDWA